MDYLTPDDNIRPQVSVVNESIVDGLFRLAMGNVLVAARTVLLQFHAALGVLPVFLSCVRPLLALGAGQRHGESIRFLSSRHSNLVSGAKLKVEGSKT